MSIQWNDSFKIGIKEIDNQHRELFLRLEKLESALRKGKGREAVISTFHFLDNYVRLHFRAEEELQEFYEYPHREMHAEEHSYFRKRLMQLEESLSTEDPSEMLAVKTNALLTQWLIKHVTSLDKELVVYFNDARTKQWEKWLTSQF